MSGLVENFIRRIEKINSSLPTIPQPGTNHVDDTWLNTDIYPGELSLRLSSSANGIYTSDGKNIIHLNTEDAILGGMILSKDTAGVNKISISSGSFRIDGITYNFISSGTDVLLPFNEDLYDRLYFIYVKGGDSVSFVTTYVSGSLDLAGIFRDITTSVNYPVTPINSILLGTVLVPSNYLGDDIWPVSVSELGDYYPKISVTPSELLRQLGTKNKLYSPQHLYFPNQILYDTEANAEYIAKKIFVSNVLSTDVENENIVQVSGGGQGTGGIYSATSVGQATEVYQETVANTFKFRSIRGVNNIQLGYMSSGNKEIYIGLSYSGLVTLVQNTLGGEGIHKGIINTSVAQLKSITGSANVNVSTSTNGDNIVISVPNIGKVNLGENIVRDSLYPVYTGMNGNNLQFNSLTGGEGIVLSTETSGLISISTSAKNNVGVSVGGGIAIYGGLTGGKDLKIKSLTGGGGVTITTTPDLITISSSGGGGSSSTGLNVGATGTTAGVIYIGMSGSQLKFGSITSGTGIAVAQDGDNVRITSTVTDGPQGRQGFKGPQGSTGTRGFQGFQGPQGPSGANGRNGTDGTIGTNGNQGWQGPQGWQGSGPQGPQGLPAADPIVTPIKYAEVYDDGVGWTVTAGAVKFITFNITRTKNSIYTVSQLVPAGTGTTIKSSEAGSYLFDFNISLSFKPDVSTDNMIARFELWNYTTNTEVPSTYAYARGNNSSIESPSVASVNMKAIIANYKAEDEYGVRCFVNVEVPGGIQGVAKGSSFTVLKLEAATGIQGPKGDGFLPYKVFTALVTQDSGSDDSLSSGAVTKGYTYKINGSDGDYSNVGAPNNNDGTYFIATNNEIPIDFGTSNLEYGTQVPVAIILENTLGNIWFTYDVLGQYICYSDGLFLEDKTTISIDSFGQNGNPGAIISYGLLDSNHFKIMCDKSGATDGILSKNRLEIRVYN